MNVLMEGHGENLGPHMNPDLGTKIGEGLVRYTYQSSGLHLLILCMPGKQPRERLKKEVQLCQQHL